MSKYCLLCFGMKDQGATLYELFLWKDVLCPQCRKKFKLINKSFNILGVKGIGLFEYNSFFSDTLVQYKECMDEALAPVFLMKRKWWIRVRYQGYTALGMPSTEEKMNERGFCHITKLFESVGIPILDCFEKQSAQKQAFSTRKQRLMMKDQIVLKKGYKIPKKVVLVDDVCTTGSTLEGAIRALRHQGVKIKILVVALAMNQEGEKIGRKD